MKGELLIEADEWGVIVTIVHPEDEVDYEGETV